MRTLEPTGKPAVERGSGEGEDDEALTCAEVLAVDAFMKLLEF